jgi:hypothetical protein
MEPQDLKVCDHGTLIIDFLDIIHRQVFSLKTTFQRLGSVSVLGDKPTQLGPIDRANLRKWQNPASETLFLMKKRGNLGSRINVE